jgi:hypothetical protein
MMCDVSHGGSVMECPTCFQKIIAPQAPGPDVKFILTGTKVSEKKINVRGVEGYGTAAPEKKFPAALVIGLILVFMVAAAGVIYWTTIIHPRQTTKNSSATNEVSSTNSAKPEKPALVAPKASDANWTLDLGTNAIPDSPVVGRVHGEDFIMERANFQNGTLTLRYGTHGPMEFGAQINFGAAQPESLAGQSLNIVADTNISARVTLRWKDADGTVQKGTYDSNYAMRLEFGPLANNRLPGKIWLCLPDTEKSYLLGSFNADARKPKPKAPKK